MNDFYVNIKDKLRSITLQHIAVCYGWKMPRTDGFVKNIGGSLVFREEYYPDIACKVCLTMPAVKVSFEQAVKILKETSDELKV